MVKRRLTFLRHGERRVTSTGGLPPAVRARIVMSRVVAIVAVAGVLSVQAAGVMAADMPNTLPPAYDPPRAVVLPARPFDLNTGWYLRGDLGYTLGRIGGATSASPFPDPIDSK